MVSATFEVATLADAIAKANRFAPKRSSALDLASGLCIDVVSGATTATVRTTDLIVFYQQVISLSGLSLDDVTWRLPNSLLEAIVSRLPTHLGAQVTLAMDGDDSMVRLESGPIKAKINSFDPALSYPAWESYPAEGMRTVEGMADRLAQVEWATEKKGDGIFTGVHLDGTHLWASDKNCVARVPFACPVDQPVTAPLQDILSLVKSYPEVQVRVADLRLQIMTDPDTQISMLIFVEPWPNVGQFLTFDFPHAVKVDRPALLATIDRMVAVASSDRSATSERAIPYIALAFGEDNLAVSMTVPGVGAISEDMKVLSDSPFTFYVTPHYLRDALLGCRRQEVTLAHPDNPMHPFRITDDLGYEAVVMPRSIK